MSSRGKKAPVSKTYARSSVSTASRSSSASVSPPVDDKKNLAKSAFAVSSTKNPAYKSSTLNKADRLFDEIFAAPPVPLSQVNPIKKSLPLSGNELKIIQSVQQPINVEMKSPEKLNVPPPRLYNTRSSPRSAEKRPLFGIGELSQSPIAEKRQSDSAASSQTSLSGRMDNIQIESPSKKLHRQMWKNDSPSEKSVDDSLFVNTSDTEDKSESAPCFSNNTSMLESEADDDSDNNNNDEDFPEPETKPEIVKEQLSVKPQTRKPIYHHVFNSEPEDDFDTLPVSSSEPNLTTRPPISQKSIPQNRKIVGELRRIQKQPEKFYEDPVMQVKCRREDKSLFTVVKKVRQADQCLAAGQMMQIEDDVSYYLEGLTESQDINVRRLSLYTLARKCVETNFRAHLRAYGYAKKLFHMLATCHTDPILSLNTACIFYLLSRDRSSFPIDAEILNLALKLMNLDEKKSLESSLKNNSISQTDFDKFKTRAWEILSDWHKGVQSLAGLNQKVAFDITMENLSINFLIAESLVYIFLRNNDQILRLSMCKFGGLDILVRKLQSQLEFLPPANHNISLDFEQINIDQLKLIERYFHILTQVTEMCPKNQAYLIAYDNALVVGVVVKYFQLAIALLPQLECKETTPDLKKLILNLLTVCLKTLCNLTHLNETGCQKFGASDGFLIDCIDLLSIGLRKNVPVESRFDFSTLILGLLINLIEPCNANRRILISGKISIDETGTSSNTTKSVIQILLEKYLRHETIANQIDEDVDKKIDFCNSQEKFDGGAAEFAQQFKETLESAVSQAGQHMEDSMICAHIALFFGLLLQQNENIVEEIKYLSRPDIIKSMVTMINKFMEFLRLINNLNTTTERTMCTAVELLERLA